MGLDIMLYHFSEPKIDTSKKYTLQELDDLDLNSITSQLPCPLSKTKVMVVH